MPSEGEDQARKQPPRQDFRTPGLRSVRTTSVFRVVNFELFAKPNKFLMATGLIAISLCAGYLTYLNMNRDKTTYVAISEDGNRTLQYKTSKWD